MIIAALLVAIYKWIMSSDDNEEQKQETTEEMKEPANNETKENVKGQTEEAKAEDTVENHNK